jgi:hypothetical protein
MQTNKRWQRYMHELMESVLKGKNTRFLDHKTFQTAPGNFCSEFAQHTHISVVKVQLT